MWQPCLWISFKAEIWSAGNIGAPGETEREEMENTFEPQALVRRFSDKLVEDTARHGSDSAFRKGFVQEYQYEEQSEQEDVRLRKWFEAWRPTTAECVLSQY